MVCDLPYVFLQLELGWSSISVGTFLAGWIIGYGLIQALAPNITGISNDHPPDGRTALFWSLGLTAVPAMLAFALNMQSAATAALVIGLITFRPNLRNEFCRTLILDCLLCRR